MIPSYIGADPPEWDVARDASSGEPCLKPRRLSYLTPQRSILALESNQSSCPAKLFLKLNYFASSLAVSAKRGHRGSRMLRHVQADLPQLIPPALAKPTPRSPPQQKAVLGVSVECDVRRTIATQ